MRKHAKGSIQPLWKPEIAVHILFDQEVRMQLTVVAAVRLLHCCATQEYPVTMHSQLPLVDLRSQARLHQLDVCASRQSAASDRTLTRHTTQSGVRYAPSVIVDEFGLTSDKFISLNASVSELPLSLLFSPISAPRHRLMRHLQVCLALSLSSNSLNVCTFMNSLSRHHTAESAEPDGPWIRGE
jgi:hypothetical protein